MLNSSSDLRFKLTSSGVEHVSFALGVGEYNSDSSEGVLNSTVPKGGMGLGMSKPVQAMSAQSVLMKEPSEARKGAVLMDKGLS
jgi:hypothetical protein